MQINLDDYLVLNSDGTVDTKGMLNSLAGVVDQYAQGRDGSNSALEKVLDEIFDGSDKDSIQTTTLAFKVIMLRGGDVDKDLSATKKELKAFVDAHPRFSTVPGRTGGIKRLPKAAAPETTETVAAAAE